MGALSGLAHEMLQLSKNLFDGVQVWRVGRQEQQLGSDAANGLADSGAFVTAQIVHDDHVAGRQGRDKELLDIVDEALAIDRLVEDAWGVDPVAPESRKERHRAPVAIRHFGMKPLASWCPAPKRGHIGLGPSFVDKDETSGIKPPLVFPPLRAPPRDLQPQLLCGENGFF